MKSENKGKGLSSYQYKKNMDNSAVNSYWPKALVTTFMINRYKAKRLIKKNKKDNETK